MGRLDVRVCAARNLADTEMFSKPDPYAVVKLENQTHRTRVIDNNLNPQWDEVFKFTVADENSSQLRVELWNKNVLSDEFLGQYSLSIAGLTKGVVKDGWYLLQQSKSNAELHVRLLAVDFGITSESQQPPASATVLMAAAPNFQAPTFAATQPPLPIPPPPPPPQPVQGIPLQQHSSTLPLGATSPSCYPTNYYTNDVSCAAAPPSAYYSPQQTQPHPYSVGNNNTPFVEVVHAWYGTDAQHSDNNGRVPQQIREIIQRNNGRIVLDGNLNGLFGFDPVFGQIKVCAMHVRYNGQDQHLRAMEGQPFSFPDGGFHQQGGFQGGPHVELLNAWYGTDAQHSDNNGRVIQQIREIIQRNNGRIVLDGNLNGLFGFDPVFGQIKVCAMHVRYNGQDQHLRAFESQPFYFP